MGAQIAVPATLRNSALLGLGVHRPERVVTNAEICEQIDSSDEWIQSRSGIKERRFAKAHPEETIVDMSVDAASKALDAAGLSGPQIDTVIIATSTYGFQTPQAAALVADRLGTGGAAALDIQADALRHSAIDPEESSTSTIRPGSSCAVAGGSGEAVAAWGWAPTRRAES